MLDHSQTALISFDSDLYGSFNVWTDEQGREYFRALDVCTALRLGNVSQSLKRYVFPEYIIKINDGSHRAGETNYLSEPGLYQLIFASGTDWAKQFQRWVFEDVLPKLRRTNNASSIVSAHSAAPQLALPSSVETSLAKRQALLPTIMSMTTANASLNYKNPSNPEQAVLQRCAKHLVFGHDYGHADGEWWIAYPGLSELIQIAKSAIDIEAFGNDHTLNNLNKYSEEIEIGSHSIRMEKSAIMQSGLTNDWYPISMDGLRHFASVWDGSNFAIWHDFRKLCSTLNTGRYVHAVRKDAANRSFRAVHHYQSLSDRGWAIIKHPHYSYLWSLTTSEDLVSFPLP